MRDKESLLSVLMDVVTYQCMTIAMIVISNE